MKKKPGCEANILIAIDKVVILKHTYCFLEYLLNNRRKHLHLWKSKPIKIKASDFLRIPSQHRAPCTTNLLRLYIFFTAC